MANSFWSSLKSMLVDLLSVIILSFTRFCCGQITSSTDQSLKKMEWLWRITSSACHSWNDLFLNKNDFVFLWKFVWILFLRELIWVPALALNSFLIGPIDTTNFWKCILECFLAFPQRSTYALLESSSLLTISAPFPFMDAVKKVALFLIFEISKLEAASRFAYLSCTINTKRCVRQVWQALI